MTDRYLEFVNSPFGSSLTRSIGLPQPVKLVRYAHGTDFVGGDILAGAASNFEILPFALQTISQSSGKLFIDCQDKTTKALLKAEGMKAQDAEVFAPDKVQALVYDASGIADSTELEQLYFFFHHNVRKLDKCGRIVILGRAIDSCKTIKQTTAQRALLGFVKSLAKEMKKGATANLLYLRDDAGSALESSLRFFLSPRSAYVSGQSAVISLTNKIEQPDSWERPLEGKFALVTGAARGIGAAIAKVLARQGAIVVGLDIPAAEEALEKLMGQLDGHTLLADITQADAASQIIDCFKVLGASIDIIVHNAGITRDKTIAKMKPEWWQQTLDINLSATERINDALFEQKQLNHGAKIICVSSMNGIAGAKGQTNYSTSKAGVIGMVESMAPALAKQGVTINAVAPGFIETDMTAAMPLGPREAGRRLNSMAQGGLPEDVAETIAWFANPASSGVNGNIVRVCGQSVIGA